MYSAWKETRHLFGRDCIIVWGALLSALVFTQLWFLEPSGSFYRDANTLACWFLIGFVVLVCLALLVEEYLPIDPQRYGRMILIPMKVGDEWIHVLDIENITHPVSYPISYAMRPDGTLWSYTKERHKRIYAGPTPSYFAVRSAMLSSTYHPTDHLVYDPTVPGYWKEENTNTLPYRGGGE